MTTTNQTTYLQRSRPDSTPIIKGNYLAEGYNWRSDHYFKTGRADYGKEDKGVPNHNYLGERKEWHLVIYEAWNGRNIETRVKSVMAFTQYLAVQLVQKLDKDFLNIS